MKASVNSRPEPAQPELACQQAQHSNANTVARPGQRAALARRPILHLKNHADKSKTELQPNPDLPKLG